MTVSIHLIEWIILLAGLAAAMVSPTAPGTSSGDSEDVCEAPEQFLARIAADA